MTDIKLDGSFLAGVAAGVAAAGGTWRGGPGTGGGRGRGGRGGGRGRGGGVVGGGAKTKEMATLARRRLFLLVEFIEKKAADINNINIDIFKSEIRRLVKSSEEMEKLLTKLEEPCRHGTTEERFLRSAYQNVEAFAKTVGAL